MPEIPPVPEFGFTVLVPNGGTTNAVGVNLKGQTVMGVYIPGTFTGATLGFTAATAIDGTYVPVYGTDGALISIPVGTSRFVALDPVVFAGINFLKVTVPSQGAELTLTLATRRL